MNLPKEIHEVLFYLSYLTCQETLESYDAPPTVIEFEITNTRHLVFALARQSLVLLSHQQ